MTAPEWRRKGVCGQQELPAEKRTRRALMEVA
jgi:hypothetical protein